jgi:hypothetical protein
MRYLNIAAFGAVIGMAMVWLGFNFRLGGPGSSLWLSGPAAYAPAAIAGAATALLIDFLIRKWT